MSKRQISNISTGYPYTILQKKQGRTIAGQMGDYKNIINMDVISNTSNSPENGYIIQLVKKKAIIEWQGKTYTTNSEGQTLDPSILLDLFYIELFRVKNGEAQNADQFQNGAIFQLPCDINGTPIFDLTQNRTGGIVQQTGTSVFITDTTIGANTNNYQPNNPSNLLDIVLNRNGLPSGDPIWNDDPSRPANGLWNTEVNVNQNWTIILGLAESAPVIQQVTGTWVPPTTCSAGQTHAKTTFRTNKRAISTEIGPTNTVIESHKKNMNRTRSINTTTYSTNDRNNLEYTLPMDKKVKIGGKSKRRRRTNRKRKTKRRRRRTYKNKK